MSYVWVLSHHYEDGPEGGEDIGVFRSRIKAQRFAREHAGLPPRTRKMDWQEVTPRLWNAEIEEKVKEESEYDGKPSYRTIRYGYFLKQWEVQ